MKYLNILILAYSLSSAAEIRQTSNMAEAFREVQPTDVLVLDIDNTILEPVQTLGSDQWFGHTVTNYVKSGLSEKLAVDSAIEDWQQVQNATAVKAIERTTPFLIRQAQERGTVVFALTARPLSLKHSSIRQLRSLGVSLKNPVSKYSEGDSVELFQGVLFVGPHNNKGQVLAKFFESQKLRPSRLIFVDDKEKHVKNMDAVFTEIPNVNFRYGAADATVKSFSSDIANLQWSYFLDRNYLLSDAEAKALLLK
jgi:hypothetical protein